MIEINKIYNEHCFDTMSKMEKGSVNLIITSPFYNTNAKAKGNQTLKNCCESAKRTNSVRYDEFVDVMSNDEYCQFTKELFDYFDKHKFVDYNKMFDAVFDSPMQGMADALGWKTHEEISLDDFFV